MGVAYTLSILWAWPSLVFIRAVVIAEIRGIQTGHSYIESIQVALTESYSSGLHISTYVTFTKRLASLAKSYNGIHCE